MAEFKVGGEVDSFCTKCKMTLAHTVLAVWAGQIKRVRCNTCMGEHAFRAPSGSSSSSASKAAKPAARTRASSAPAAAAAKVSRGYEELLAGKNRGTARRYDIKDAYAVGDLIEHPTFGLGVVAAVRGADKIDVAFPSTARTLLHKRGAAPVPLARPLPAKVPDVALADDDSDPTEETSDEVPTAARR